MREFLSIQYLRAIAAAMVVVYHCLNGAVPEGARNGFAYEIWASGVDVFFVVSGFIMWATTCERSIGPIGFWQARIVRIVPLFWVALAAYWVMLAGLNGLAAAPGLSDVMHAFAFVPYRDEATGLIAPYLTAGWTLTHEMIFYAVFGVCLWATDRRVRAVAVVAVFTGLVGLRVFIGAESPVAFRLTSPLAFEFLGGMVLAIAFGRLSGAALPKMVRPLVALAAVAFLFTVTRPHVDTWPRTLVFGVPAVAAVFLTVSTEAALIGRPIAWLKEWGDASYSIYLSNEGFLLLVDRAIPNHPMPMVVEIVVLFCASMVVGILVHRGIEKPLSRFFRHRRAVPVPRPTVG